MNTAATSLQTLQRSGEDNPPFFLTAVAWELWELAAAGRGMATIAERTYNSDDWHLVGTVFHECGHAAAARHMGELPWITINAPGSGVCQRTDERFHLPQALRTFALAGPVGECLAKYGLQQDGSDVASWVRPSGMSDSDRIQAGTFTGTDVLACAELVRANWSAIQAEAAQVLARELARWGARAW